MTLAQMIPLAINASMFMIVFVLGLHTRSDEATYLFRQPALLVRSVVAMNVVMPSVVLVAELLIPLPPPIKIALVALAISPVPPFLPIKQKRAGGSSAYVMGLLVAASVAAIILIPLDVQIIGHTIDRDVRMPFGHVARLVSVSVLLPLALGILLASARPALAARIAKPITLGSALLLLAVLVPVVIHAWPAIHDLIGRGVVAVLLLFPLVGLLVGHWLGGPDEGNRTALALATSTRHPGVAIAIGAFNFPDVKAASAVVLFHLLVGTFVSLPYIAWRKRKHAAAARR